MTAAPGRTPFPDRLVPLRRHLGELVQVLEHGRTDRWYAFATLFERRVKLAVSGPTEGGHETVDRGVVLRIVAGGRSWEWAGNDLAPDALIRGASTLRDTVEAADPDPAGPTWRPRTWAEEHVEDLDPAMREQLPDTLGPDVPVHFGTACVEDPDDTDVLAVGRVARELRDRIRARSDAAGTSLTLVRAMAVQEVATVVFRDRCKDMSQVRVITTARAMTASPASHRHAEQLGGMGGLERLRLEDDAVDRLVTLPAALASAQPLVPGRYTVLTSPEVTGVLAHEAFGHTQEGDTRVLGRSCATALQGEGRRVGTEGATIYSNAAVFDGGTTGSLYFDDEGQLARPQRILDRGVVAGPMNDLLSALTGDALGPAPRQCNGRRSSWRRPLMARQTNTYFAPGDRTFEDLLASVEHGYLAEYAAGGMEDPKGMSLCAGVSFLREIRDGKLTGRLFVGPSGGHVELSDPVSDILLGLVASADRLEVRCGGCEKYHKEPLEVGMGGPWTLWKAIRCG